MFLGHFTGVKDGVTMCVMMGSPILRRLAHIRNSSSLKASMAPWGGSNLDGGNRAVVMGFYSKPILRLQKLAKEQSR